jgi:hypothetical protein
MTTIATLVAQDVSAAEAALAKLERELENTDGERRAALERWVGEVRRALGKVRRLTLH